MAEVTPRTDSEGNIKLDGLIAGATFEILVGYGHNKIATKVITVPDHDVVGLIIE